MTLEEVTALFAGEVINPNAKYSYVLRCPANRDDIGICKLVAADKTSRWQHVRIYVIWRTQAGKLRYMNAMEHQVTGSISRFKLEKVWVERNLLKVRIQAEIGLLTGEFKLDELEDYGSILH